MSWLRWAAKENNSRAENISGLEDAFPAVKSHPNKNQYDVKFSPSGKEVTLRVYLPPSFPDGPPVLQLLSPVQHPWINQYNQVNGHPYLKPGAWSNSYRLATLVLEVIAELTGGGSGARASAGPGGGDADAAFARSLEADLNGGGAAADRSTGGSGGGGAARRHAPPPAYDAVGGATPPLPPRKPRLHPPASGPRGPGSSSPHPIAR